MLRFRRKTVHNQHRAFADLAWEWNSSVPMDGLWFYVLHNGIPHMLGLGMREEAEERLSDLAFTGALLDHCIYVLHDDYTPLWRLWRIFGEERAKNAYLGKTASLEVQKTDDLPLLRNVVEFALFAMWKEAAVEIARKVSEEHQRLLGLEDMGTLSSLNQYALSEKEVKRSDVAIQISGKVLEGQLKLLGADHPEVYLTMSSLASMLNAAKRYAEAEPLFRRAIENRGRLLGELHPKTLISVAGLGWMLVKMGRCGEAHGLLLRAQEGRERLLGSKHPKTLAAYQNLGWCLYQLKRYPEARDCLGTAAMGRASVLGMKHSKTMNSRIKYATVLLEMGCETEAAGFLRENISIQTEQLGEGHRKTLRSLMDLGMAYQRSGEIEKACRAAEKVAARARGSLRSDHPTLVEALLCWMDWLWELGDRNGSLAVGEEACAHLSTHLGERSRPHLKALAEQGNRYCLQGQQSRGLRLLAIAGAHWREQSEAEWERCRKRIVRHGGSTAGD
jgi:tetratricopeptide (TPR) repeat protein